MERERLFIWKDGTTELRKVPFPPPPNYVLLIELAPFDWNSPRHVTVEFRRDEDGMYVQV